ncbi:hypothetical protein VXC91_37675 [Streptomyces chiangmaiensis]|uniref:Lipoprotein n=2 Tax=Streptomyces chiangmaiensis TaxID=766497 RepID=A0ABU7FTP6_9ACTN|nr:hypothetical protein [Streptomyces chiangmaiensis]MED7827480.1 hypothetical protein [Streptomyces chiangmaiensis]
MPALTASALLLASGCSSGPGSPATSDAGRDGRAGASAVATVDTGRPIAVAAAPGVTPTALARPGDGGGRARQSALKVRSYDRHTGRAVISRTAKGAPGPSGTPSAPSSGAPDNPAEPGPVAVGDLIASAPAPGAPDGLLVKVTEVLGKTGAGTEVQTAPTTLDSLLGGDKAKGTVPVDPSSFDVERLLPDVKVSWARTGDLHFGPEGTHVPLGRLRLDVRAEVPTAAGAPVTADASVAGYVQVAPEVDFSYGGAGSDADARRAGPVSAYLGVSGDWSSQWSLKGRAPVSAKPVRLPFARLHADPVLQVGPIPVVVNLDLTCYLEVSGDGSATVSVEQAIKGDFKAGGTFGPDEGWTPVSESAMASTPVRASVATAGNVKVALGAEASVGLYGAAGVTADLAPYLRGEASATASAGPGGRPTAAVVGSWTVYGGVDLSGALQLQLSVFGTPVLRHTVPLGALHREWRLAGSDV